MGEKEERNHKRRKLQVHFTVCTFALYPSVHQAYLFRALTHDERFVVLQGNRAETL